MCCCLLLLFLLLLMLVVGDDGDIECVNVVVAFAPATAAVFWWCCW